MKNSQSAVPSIEDLRNDLVVSYILLIISSGFWEIARIQAMLDKSVYIT